MISGANTQMPNGREIQGIVVDVDSIINIEPYNFTKFANELEPKLERLRQANKAWFFKCLKKDTIRKMGPKYE